MNTPPVDPPDLTVIEEYLRACEAGGEPDRRAALAGHPAVEGLRDALDALRSVGMTPPPEEPVPAMIGEYHVLRVAGRGGMGVVYEAVQADPPRAVALKVLAPARAGDAEAAERFRTEMRAAGRLHHTNIVPVLATVPGADGPTAYAMPYIRGRSLAAVIRALRGDPEATAAEPMLKRIADLAWADRGGIARAVAEWVRQAAEAVAAAHAAGVVHRDVKPGNLLLEFDRTGRPHVWLTDFGLAVEEDDPAGPPGVSVVGTPGYRSPEQAAGDPAGARPPTDVYALGATLSELLTLERPADGGPVAAGRGVPRELRRVVARATAALPGDRYPTAADLADDLARFLAGFPVRAGRREWGRGLTLWAARHRRALAAAGVAVALSAAAAGGLLARAYAAERSARLRADAARKAVAANTMRVDDILYATPGRLDTEREMLEQAVRVQELQLEVEPEDLFASRHLAHASWRLSRVYARLGRAAEAVAPAERAVMLYRELAAADPENPLHLLDAARALSVVASAHRQTRPPDEEAALRADADALRTVRELAADPRFKDLVYVHDAVATYTTAYAHALVAAGSPAEAEALYREAIALADRCRAAHTDQAGQWRLASPAAGGRMRLAQLLAGRGRLGEALRENADALQLSNELLKRAERDQEASRLEVLSFRLSRTELLADRAAWRIASGEPAGQAAAELAAAARVLAAEHPDWKGAEQERAALARAWAALRDGRREEAVVAGREYERLLVAQPASADRATLLSRYYADGPGERDPAKAEREAREALRLRPDDRPATLALAAALYRRGIIPDAEAALAPIATRPPNRTAFLVLAAAAASRGRAAEARRLLGEASRASVPAELCTPEWESEVKQVLASKE